MNTIGDHHIGLTALHIERHGTETLYGIDDEDNILGLTVVAQGFQLQAPSARILN